MTLKYIIALAIFLTFVCFAAFILIYASRTKREQQQTQQPLDEHDQQADINADADENAALDGLSEYFIKKNSILPKVLMDLYVRLSAVFNGQYIIAPQVLARDLVELELEDEPVAPVDVLQAQQYADEFVFDFVLSDAHTGELVLAMINEDAISAQPEGEFIIALFKRTHIPVFRYETLSGLDDNALAVNIAESIDDGRFSQFHKEFIMSLSKKQRIVLRAKFGGRCAYCGEVLKEKGWHADHVEPVLRKSVQDMQAAARGKFKLKATGEVFNESANCLENLFPACAPCNLLKTTYSLEMFRKQISLQVERARKSSMNFRTAERFGQISIVEKPIVFWFEQYSEKNGAIK